MRKYLELYARWLSINIADAEASLIAQSAPFLLLVVFGSITTEMATYLTYLTMFLIWTDTLKF